MTRQAARNDALVRVGIVLRDRSHRRQSLAGLGSVMSKPTTRSAKRKAPWKKPAPKKSRHTHLTPADKAEARRSAKRASRPYPNLVDNMRVAAKKRSSGRKKPAKRAAKQSH